MEIYFSETVIPGGHLASLACGSTVLDLDIQSGQGFINPKTSQEPTGNVAPHSTFQRASSTTLFVNEMALTVR